MQRQAGDQTFRHERSARHVAGWFDEIRPANLGARSEECTSSEDSIAGSVGKRLTAAIWFEDSATRRTPNQSLEPTSVLGTSAAEQPLVPSTLVAHL